MIIELQTQSSNGTVFAQPATDLGAAFELAKSARRPPNVAVIIRIDDDTTSFQWRRKDGANEWQRIPPFACTFCGQASWYEASEQSAPADYCHPSDHGDPESFDADYERNCSCL